MRWEEGDRHLFFLTAEKWRDPAAVPPTTARTPDCSRHTQAKWTGEQHSQKKHRSLSQNCGAKHERTKRLKAGGVGGERQDQYKTKKTADASKTDSRR